MNGSSVDMARLRKAYESNPYEAEQLLKVQDVQLYSSPVFFYQLRSFMLLASVVIARHFLKITGLSMIIVLDYIGCL